MEFARRHSVTFPPPNSLRLFRKKPRPQQDFLTRKNPAVLSIAGCRGATRPPRAQRSGARDSVGLLALPHRLLRLPNGIPPVTYWSILSITAAGPHRLMESPHAVALPDFPVTPSRAPNLLMNLYDSIIKVYDLVKEFTFFSRRKQTFSRMNMLR